jgi:hypothetical protein
MIRTTSHRPSHLGRPCQSRPGALGREEQESNDAAEQGEESGDVAGSWWG